MSRRTSVAWVIAGALLAVIISIRVVSAKEPDLGDAVVVTPPVVTPTVVTPTVTLTPTPRSEREAAKQERVSPRPPVDDDDGDDDD
jgi:hypothetical protein